MRLLERELQLGALHEYVADARAGDGRLVLVCGEAGIGKSSLVDAFLAQVEDARVAWTACDGAFTPSALGPLQDVADQWGGAVRVACADGVPREARFAALLSMLREHDGLSVLVVEDLHFADEATLDLVGHLARRLRGVRALVVATYRDDGLAENRALRETLGEASSQRSTRRIALPAALAGRRRRRSARHRSRAGGGARPHRRQPVLRQRGAPAEPRRAARLGPGRRPGPRRAALPAPGATCSTRPPSSVSGSSPSCWPRSRRRRPELPSTSRSPPDCWSPTGRSLRFRHEIARRAVEQEVGPHTAADAAPPDPGRAARRPAVDDDARLAHHAEGALDGPATVRHARRAGDRSAALASRREAVAQYRRALRFVPADQPLVRADLLDRLGEELAAIDPGRRATAALEESIALWRAHGVPLREGDARRRLSYASGAPAADPRASRRPSGALGRPGAPRHRPASWPGRCRARPSSACCGEDFDTRVPTSPTAPWPWPATRPARRRAATRSTPWRASRPGPVSEWFARLREAVDIGHRAPATTTRPAAPTPTCVDLLIDDDALRRGRALLPGGHWPTATSTT